MTSIHAPEPVTFELTQVARYHAFEETAGGLTLPDEFSTDHSFVFSLPGVVTAPAMIYYRTRHTPGARFSVRLNEARLTQYEFVDGDELERTWHEIIPASTVSGPTLRADGNELILFAGGAPVVFGDIVIIYTSDQTTVPVRVQPGPVAR